MDVSFWGVNAKTLPAAPSEVMQFGRMLERILYRIRHANPAFGPVCVGKIDISNAFYCIPLAPDDAPTLAVLLPQLPSEPPLVAIPLALPMGWIESPPYLCSVTKTAADLANHRMFLNYLPPHQLEAAASTKTSPPLAFLSDMPLLTPDHATENAIISAPPAPSHSVTMTPLAHPLSYFDPYMDDFVSLVQGNRHH